VPVADRVPSALGELRRELQGELEELVKRRSGLERQLQTLRKEIESKQRALELVEATERQWAGQRQGQPHVEGLATGVSTQVRAYVKLQDTSGPVWPTVGSCPRCDSPRQRLPSSGLVPRRPMSSRNLSHSPRGPSPTPCGRTTCCRC
jgi:hypothetical protein